MNNERNCFTMSKISAGLEPGLIEPSRELAEQTFQQLEKFKKFLKDPTLREYLLIGGQSSKEQINELQKGVDVIHFNITLCPIP